jgi:uncharacterized protein
VERAEQAVREVLAAAGIPVADLRVRDLGATARLEVDAAAVTRVAAHARALRAVREAGFADVEVSAFRSGSMNDLLDPAATPG